MSSPYRDYEDNSPVDKENLEKSQRRVEKHRRGLSHRKSQENSPLAKLKKAVRAKTSDLLGKKGVLDSKKLGSRE